MSEFDTLGPYRVAEKLGQGGMGTVYRGAHVKTGQRVAIKVLARQMSQEPRFRRRFDAEIETLKNLSHPNIVRLIGYGEEQGLLFYSMELVEGPSLLEHLRKVKRLDWDAVLAIGIDICAALKHAHDFGVIHRDLKPANLLMEPEGRLKLTDFGIAKLFGTHEQTAAGSVLGTADYMAPEQAAGGVVTPRTDLYALGSLLYACLVGRPPFGGRNLTQVVHGLKHESPPPLDLVLPEVPLELAELVHELLEKLPENRPPTALAVGKRLASMRVGLHRRGQATELHLGGPTVSDAIPGSSGETTFPERLPLDVESSGSEHPTLSGSHSDVPTGGAVGAAGTLPSHVVHRGRQTPSADPGAGESASAEPGAGELASAEPAPTLAALPRSRFEAVPAEGRRGTWGESSDERRDPWHWISIGGLLLLLLVTIAISVWMLRKPSPDALLAAIAAAEAAGDPQGAKSATDDFLRLYPRDPMAEALRESQNVSEVEQMARRLRSQALRFGGVDLLDPSHQAWLEAVANREQAPHVAAEKLQTWLDVFGHPDAVDGHGPGDDSLRRLTELTRREAERLKSSTDPWTDPRTERLAIWLEWGRENLQGSERERFLEGLATLYRDKPWAAPVLEQITQELEAP